MGGRLFRDQADAHQEDELDSAYGSCDT
jgi:hypothetical protein